MRCRGFTCPLEGVHTGEHLAQQQTEPEDIGRGRRRVAAKLFGAGVARRQIGGSGLRSVNTVVDQLRDAEVDEFGGAVRSDEDIGRLDIAVDDEVAMRVGDSTSQLQPEIESSLHARLRAREPDVQCDAVDPLHDEIRLGELVEPGVE